MKTVLFEEASRTIRCIRVLFTILFKHQSPNRHRLAIWRLERGFLAKFLLCLPNRVFKDEISAANFIFRLSKLEIYSARDKWICIFRANPSLINSVGSTSLLISHSVLLHGKLVNLQHNRLLWQCWNCLKDPGRVSSARIHRMFLLSSPLLVIQRTRNKTHRISGPENWKKSSHFDLNKRGCEFP
ncbi:hypothetical protein L218DRAFT_287134 [Marasmius fiardii PR-910]|nr:hypothetical protein L218DRAFT_287134 [Marasmius fiardii PR-910]